MPVILENCSKQNIIPQSAAELATQPNFPLPRVKCTRHHRMGLFPCGGVRHTRSPRNPRAQFKNKTNFPTSLLCGIRYFHFLKKEREREKSVAYSKFSHANQGFSRFNQIVVLLLQDLIHMVSLFFLYLLAYFIIFYILYYINIVRLKRWSLFCFCF